MAKGMTMTAEYLGSLGVIKALAGSTPLAKKVGRKLFNAYARRVRDAMRGAAPEREGRTRKSIKARSTRSGGAQVYGDRRIAPHIHFLDSGTKQRKTKKGANRGKVDATHWLRKEQERARAAYKAEVAEPLMKELTRLIKESIPRV